MKILLIISVFWLISEIVLAYVKRAASGSNNFDKSSLKLLWIIITTSVSIGLYLGFAGIGFLNVYKYESFIVGLSFITIGLLIRWISIIQLKKYFTVNVNISKNHQLIKNGIYKYIRHPSYTGSLISFLGLGIVLNNWISLLVIFLPILFTFLYRISIEENALSNSFGYEYEKYIKKTKKLIPGIY